MDPARSSDATSTTAQAVVRELVAAGVTHAFTVPGESFLGVLDALRDSPIRVIATRHEGGAAFMAEGFAKLARRPAVCLGTRAVGAANLAIGIHTAAQDSTPLLALVGQVRTDDRGREAFQEIDQVRFLGALSPYVVEPAAAADLPIAVRTALRHTVSGRPGPACVAMREDLLRVAVPPQESTTAALGSGALGSGALGSGALGSGACGDETEVVDGARPVGAREAPEWANSIPTTLTLLRRAHRPVLLTGLEVIADAAADLAVALAEREGVPVLSVWRRPDSFPNDHPNYAGMTGLSVLPGTRAALADADLWIVVGDRLDENTLAGYALPRTGTDVVHAWRGGGTIPGGIGIPAGAREFLEALVDASAADPAPVSPAREDYVRGLRHRWERESTPVPRPVADGYVDQFAVAAALRDLLPRDVVTVTDAGNFSGWPARYLRWREPGTFLGPISGAMGYAVPAAVGARLARPDRPVVAFVGDGGFLMTAAELQTAAREGIEVTVIVYDNERYNTIRMHQERQHPGRPIATHLGASDLAGVARALGAWAREVTSISDFATALPAALAYPGPAVVVVRCDPEQLAVSDWDQ